MKRLNCAGVKESSFRLRMAVAGSGCIDRSNILDAREKKYFQELETTGQVHHICLFVPCSKQPQKQRADWWGQVWLSWKKLGTSMLVPYS